MATVPSAARTRQTLAACVALLGVTATLVGTVIPGWAYPLMNTAVAVALIAIARIGGATMQAIGLTVGRRTLLAAAIGLMAVTAVLATGWTLPGIRQVFITSPAASSTGTDLLWAMLVRVPFGTVLLEEVAFRGVLPALMGADGRRWMWRPVLGASVLFGLFHLFPALHQGRCDALAGHSLFCPAGPILGTAAVMITAMGLGVALCAVRHIGGGLLAPFTVHTAANSAGYLLAWMTAE